MKVRRVKSQHVRTHKDEAPNCSKRKKKKILWVINTRYRESPWQWGCGWGKAAVTMSSNPKALWNSALGSQERTAEKSEVCPERVKTLGSQDHANGSSIFANCPYNEMNIIAVSTAVSPRGKSKATNFVTDDSWLRKKWVFSFSVHGIVHLLPLRN